MEFCPKCGKLLTKKDDKSVCISCKYEKKAVKLETKEKMEARKSIPVIEKEETSLPTVNQECPKCHHDKAYFWQLQTRAGDEPPTNFYKCLKCKHTWRDYS